METQEQEIEAFRNWWRSNGKVMVIGVLAGLGGIVGWNWWQAEQQREAERASALYSEVVNEATAGNADGALSGSKLLFEAHPDSGYASLAALVSARSAYTAGKIDEAIGQLRWVAQHAKDPAIADVARVRLARVLRSTDKRNQASSALDAVQSAAFSAIVDELRGDLAYDAKDLEAAARSYRGALAAQTIDAVSAQRVRTKLGDLGVAVADK